MEIPSHCDTGLLPQKGKRDLNGEQPCAVTVFFFYILQISCTSDSNVERAVFFFSVNYFYNLILKTN